MKTFDLSKFRNHHLVMELRYSPSYLLWDRAGRLWTRVLKEFPGCELNKAEPNNTQFTFDDVQLGVALEKLFILAHRAKPAEFIEMADKFSRIVLEELEILELKRIGARQVWVLDLASRDETSRELTELGLLKIPAGKFFAVDGASPVEPEYKLRWENERMGVWITLRTQHEKIEFDAPLNIRDVLDQKTVERSQIYCDVDHYTKTDTSVGLFAAKPWLENSFHVVRRDISKFFGGAS